MRVSYYELSAVAGADGVQMSPYWIFFVQPFDPLIFHPLTIESHFDKKFNLSANDSFLYLDIYIC